MASAHEAHFRATAPAYMRRMLEDFPALDELDACAAFGNAGHESKGLTDDQEDRPVVKGSRGGANWMQWTGPRRRALEAFAKERGLDSNGDEAAYLFLVHELRGPEKKAIGALRRAKTLKGKTEAFCRSYLRPGVPHYASRLRWAQIALDALRGGTAPKPATRKATAELITAVQQALLDKGYTEVGRVDGRYGDKTRLAIIAFEDKNGLPLTGQVTPEILGAILNSAPRPVSEERAGASPKEIREQVPEVRANWFGQIWSAIAAAGALVTGAFSWLMDNLSGIKEQIQPALDVLGDVPLWLYLALFAAAAFFAWQKMRKGYAGGLAAYRAGERR